VRPSRSAAADAHVRKPSSSWSEDQGSGESPAGIDRLQLQVVQTSFQYDAPAPASQQSDHQAPVQQGSGLTQRSNGLRQSFASTQAMMGSLSPRPLEPEPVGPDPRGMRCVTERAKSRGKSRKIRIYSARPVLFFFGSVCELAPICPGESVACAFTERL